MSFYTEDTRSMSRKLGKKHAEPKKVFAIGVPVSLQNVTKYQGAIAQLLASYFWKTGKVVAMGAKGTTRSTQVEVEFIHDQKRFWIRKDALRLE